MNRNGSAIAVGLVHACLVVILLQVANFYSFVVRACLKLGYWPAYNRPDPKLLGFEAHYEFVIVGFWAALLSALLAVVLFWAAKALGASKTSQRLALRLLGGCFLFGVVVWLTDPGGLADWFLD